MYTKCDKTAKYVLHVNSVYIRLIFSINERNIRGTNSRKKKYVWKYVGTDPRSVSYSGRFSDLVYPPLL